MGRIFNIFREFEFEKIIFATVHHTTTTDEIIFMHTIGIFKNKGMKSVEGCGLEMK